ncbi:hypothetical protein FRC09_000088 [Ceratobasidium sp. 395]|nr:hypothetical protein FRC09_000088 [Ceratobasidium sp. 395]
MSTSSGPSFRYISPTELSELIKSDKKPMKDYAVVDVRDDDFIGGNIVGCVRAPSNDYLTTVDGLVTKTKDVPKMIFHCALSQQRQVTGTLQQEGIYPNLLCRGPKAARIYAATRNGRLGAGETSPQEIYVLRGGFTEFQALFKDDPVLVEKWRKEVWQTVLEVPAAGVTTVPSAAFLSARGSLDMLSGSSSYGVKNSRKGDCDGRFLSIVVDLKLNPSLRHEALPLHRPVSVPPNDHGR